MRLLPQVEIDWNPPSPAERYTVAVSVSPPVIEAHDAKRMGMQRTRLLAYLAAGAWWTLAGLAEATGYPEASVSARLRDYRKPRYGGHTVERRRVGEGRGLWEYRLILNEGGER